MNTTLTPSNGVLVVTTNGPVSVSLTPNAGALATATQAASITISSQANLTPAVGSAAYTGYLPAQLLTLPSPFVGNLALAGSAPTVTIQFTLTSPGTGTLSLSGVAPSVSTAFNLTPGAGSLALTGYAGTIVLATVALFPQTGTLSINGNAPLALTAFKAQPNVGSAAFTGQLPKLNGTFVLSPAAGGLALSGIAPSLNFKYTLKPSTGSVAFGSAAPTLNLAVAGQPVTGVLSLTGQTPKAVANSLRAPPVASLALTGIAPALTAQVNQSPGVVSLTLTGYPPVLSSAILNRFLSPNSGALSFASDPATLTETGGAFGSATVVALSENGVQGARSVYLQGAAAQVVAAYLNSQGLAFVPAVVQYRIDDCLSGEVILNWTDLNSAPTNEVTVTAAQNQMVSNTRPWETHQILFSITDLLGNVNYQRAEFDILRVPGGPKYTNVMPNAGALALTGYAPTLSIVTLPLLTNDSGSSVLTNDPGTSPLSAG